MNYKAFPEKRPAAETAGWSARLALEVELDGELQHARSTYSGVLADFLSIVTVRTDRHWNATLAIATRQRQVRTDMSLVEVGMVEDVERFAAKLNVNSLTRPKGDLLKQRHIPVLHATAANVAARSGKGFAYVRKEGLSA